jgi:hypothetical protein
LIQTSSDKFFASLTLLTLLTRGASDQLPLMRCQFCKE